MLSSRLPPLLLLLAASALVMSCGSSPPGLPPSSTVEHTLPISTSDSERLFVLDTDGLYEVTADGRTLFVRRPDRSFIYDAAVSPDGRSVALAIQGPPTETPTGYNFGVDLYLSRDGGEPIVVAAHERIGETMSRPNWLPGGEKLLFAILGRDETGAADLRIELLDLATGSRERFVGHALEPAVSPDGRWLAYLHYDPRTGGEVIMIAELATGETRPLLPETQIMSNVANLAWAPDGERLAFAASDPIAFAGAAPGTTAARVHPTLRDVWTVNLDGSDLHRITEIADATLSLAWSGDNRHIYAIGDTGFWSVDSVDGALELIGPPNLAGRVQTLFK